MPPASTIESVLAASTGRSVRRPDMPRNYRSTDQHVKPDNRFQSKLATKIINKIMWDGKKSVAQRIFYDACEAVAQKVGVEPAEVFLQVIENVKPRIEVRSKRVGGATYQVPMEVKTKRQQSLAIRWLVDAARAKRGKPMGRRLAAELFDASATQGAVMMTNGVMPRRTLRVRCRKTRAGSRSANRTLRGASASPATASRRYASRASPIGPVNSSGISSRVWTKYSGSNRNG